MSQLLADHETTAKNGANGSGRTPGSFRSSSVRSASEAHHAADQIPKPPTSPKFQGRTSRPSGNHRSGSAESCQIVAESNPFGDGFTNGASKRCG
ncbi:hypothetical protein [Mycolicibacterium canariasense]|uniref:hypothetical protein n=1 Tax=Mycolicibacterium canariasense TaxID=228230 RepID=UPI001F56CC21|nr:hypothetical protein [Mycolicibacterium canariasense]